MRSTVLQVRGHKCKLLLGDKPKEVRGLRCSGADADREKYNNCGRSVDSGQKLLMRSTPSLVAYKPRSLLFYVGSHVKGIRVTCIDSVPFLNQ